ncbi:hypothetical protein EDD86DRAFT_210160 [Gorgonomyces haynaldii]|nr:hypothetical protein EDD86DRAFT_210160 [Gorgonomyces haynaldii]
MEEIAIGGAGIAGLLLALALKKQGFHVTVYEQAPRFDDEVGGAIGMYANGLSVIRDISPSLLYKIRKQGRPYILRKWLRHDGTEVAVGQEKFLRPFKSVQEEEELGSIGIRRWRLQKVLLQECLDFGVKVKFGQRVVGIEIKDRVHLKIDGQADVVCDLVFGCDGLKSALRNALFGKDQEPKYTGITCLMGAAPIAKQSKIEGICFPSSQTSKCHACYYPANDEEIIFQIYFPTEEKPETWKPLSPEEGRKECVELAKLMEEEGWASMFTDPLKHANSVLRTGLRARSPIPQWTAPERNPRVFLLGDAAHPPVPYIGQGAMMAIEDVGVLSLLINKLCKPTILSNFDWSRLALVSQLYQELRFPRTTMMLERSMALGQMQLERSTLGSFEVWKKEMEIKLNVLRYGTLPVMFDGAGYDYRDQVNKKIGIAGSSL